MMCAVSRIRAGGCYGELLSRGSADTHWRVSVNVVPANEYKLTNFGEFLLRRKTYVCFSRHTTILMRIESWCEVEWAAQRLSKPYKISHSISSDGWLQGLLATEKKRPCKEIATCQVTRWNRTSV